jgi:phosphate uptake regulator
MPILSSLDENFRFIILEVAEQVDTTCSFMQSNDDKLFERIVSRDDYIDNLKSVIENIIFSKIHLEHSLDQKAVNNIRAQNTICSNLEKIADFCVNIVRQVGHIKDHSCLDEFECQQFFEEIRKCFPLILPVLQKGDLTKALIICEAELNLDRLYKHNFDLVMAKLRVENEPEDLITLLFIFRYLERIGDSLLNIGEALLYAILGEKIKITQFEALQKTLTKSGLTESLHKLRYETYWGTRSGCNISRIISGDPINELRAQDGIFKGGITKKIRAEKENLERWHKILPSLTPRIISYHEEAGKAAMLMQFMSGLTMEEVALTCDEDVVAGALNRLEITFLDIWTGTLVATPSKSDYTGQLLARLNNVKTVHPLLFKNTMQLSGKAICSTFELIRRAALVENQLAAPFTVFIHGDCNANNIIFNQETRTIHFIDLYRSRQADYLQDISVLLVSFFRMPLLAGPIRERINWIIEHILYSSKTFAADNNDQTFDTRLALGLARSFITSTRFELNSEFAKEMFLRGLYLLEKISLLKEGEIKEFTLPHDVLYY